MVIGTIVRVHVRQVKKLLCRTFGVTIDHHRIRFIIFTFDTSTHKCFFLSFLFCIFFSCWLIIKMHFNESIYSHCTYINTIELHQTTKIFLARYYHYRRQNYEIFSYLYIYFRPFEKISNFAKNLWCLFFLLSFIFLLSRHVELVSIYTLKR